MASDGPNALQMVASQSVSSPRTSDLGGTNSPKNDDPAYRRVSSVWQSLRNRPTMTDITASETAEDKELFSGREMTTRPEILAWYLVDWANSPMWNVILALILPLYLTEMATNYACSGNAENGCDIDGEPIASSDTLSVDIGLFSVQPIAFAFTMMAISGIAQLFSYVTIGALADYSYYAFYLFRITTVTAALSVGVWFLVIDSKHYFFAGIWVSVVLVLFGLSIIFYNASLPKMVENHWLVRRAIRNKESGSFVSSMKQRLSDDMSQYGQGLGYCGSLTMTIAAFLVLFITTDTQYEEFDGYGVTTGDGIDSNDELWLKKVYRVDMSFNDDHLTSIQMFYDGLSVNGSIYGDGNGSTDYSFVISDDSYISEIEMWVNNDDGYINGLRFTTQNGSTSSVFGANSLDTSSDSESTVKGDSNDYILSGYTVYVNSSISMISGLDLLMLNLEVGQIPSNFPFRIVFLLVFVWWNVFQFIALKYLKRRDGPPLPNDSNPVTFSVKSYYKSLKEAKKYPNLFRYMLCWFLFSDGVATMGNAGTIFAVSELGMEVWMASLLALEVLLFGAVGCWFFLWLQRKIGWTAKQMMTLHLAMMVLASLYVVVGVIPDAPFGVISIPEFYGYILIYAINFGSLGGYARSIFASIVPVGKESEMFALYEVSDKGSSWMGPIMVAIISNIVSIRWSMLYCAFIYMISIPVLWYGVDMDAAVKQAARHHDHKDDDKDTISEEESGRVTDVGNGVTVNGHHEGESTAGKDVDGDTDAGSVVESHTAINSESEL